MSNGRALRAVEPEPEVMPAAVLCGVEQMELRYVPRPAVQAHEVLVQVEAVGLCGTDMHIYAGHSNYNRDEVGRLIPLSEEPQILGHEIVGVVIEVGGEVDDLSVGDRVVVDQGRTCIGEQRDPVCEYCHTGDSHQCEHYNEHGITGLPGGLAEYIAIPAPNAVRIDSGLGVAPATLVEPLGCVVHAMERLLAAPARYAVDASDPARRVQNILIAGAGPAGLLFLQYLRNVLGFEGTILLSEPHDRRRALAERFGAETIDVSSEDLVTEVRERTDGRMIDLLIEATGASSVFIRIPEVIRKQATLLLYGQGHAGADLSVLSQVQFLEPTIIVPIGASGGFEEDGRPTTYVRALQLIEDGTIDVESLITHRYHSLQAVPAAFAGDHRSEEYVKGVVLL